ncbi:MAG TPA: hypothetical protein PKM63_18960 [Panacibacter sp.]|nr:hypothetical protein [Panacibacter sp.]HNP46383.1 hypothetical protein [Panacibacter sp.]
MIETGFLNRRFRTTESFQLTEWNQLTDNDRTMLLTVADVGDIYGLFISLSPGSTTQIIAGRESALIFLHCKDYFHLPNFVLSQPYGKYENLVAELVLNDILALQYQETYISGSKAAPLIFGSEWLERQSSPGKLSLLSANAIRYCFHLKNETVKSLGNKLYTFNVIPMDKSHEKYLSSVSAVSDFLFTHFPENNTLSDNWTLNRERRYWFSWSRNKSIPQQKYGETVNTYKLYLSPMPEATASLFNIAVPVLTRSGAGSFKIGQTMNGLLRPDKMVAYFENRDDLLLAANELEALCANTPAHGVPFTTQFDKNGLISFGIDFQASRKQGYSWRTWITDMLASIILQAKMENLEIDLLLEYIKVRLFIANVDISNWSYIDNEGGPDLQEKF